MSHELRRSEHRYATIPELQAGGLCLDSVGHILEVGHEMTCMCCGAIGIVTELKTGPEEGWNFEGSQWVRTPNWIAKLREEREKVAVLESLADAVASDVAIGDGNLSAATVTASNRVILFGADAARLGERGGK